MQRRSRMALVVLVALVTVGPVLLGPSRLWALTPAQVGDVAPTGAPDGKVDGADVDLALRAAAGDVTLDDAGLERADVAPVTPLASATDHPQLVRPNPNPMGPVDVGDAVVIARRAAGLIVFGEVNQPPTITLRGNGDIVSGATYPTAAPSPTTIRWRARACSSRSAACSRAPRRSARPRRPRSPGRFRGP